MARIELISEEIDLIQLGNPSDEKLKFVLQFVTTATRSPAKITDEDFSTLKNIGYSEEDIVEMLTVMEMYTGYNKIIVALGLNLED